MTIAEQKELIAKTVAETLRGLGYDLTYITRSEMIRRIGRYAYDHAVKNRKINPCKCGPAKTSPVRCLREEFESYEKTLANG